MTEEKNLLERDFNDYDYLLGNYDLEKQEILEDEEYPNDALLNQLENLKESIKSAQNELKDNKDRVKKIQQEVN